MLIAALASLNLEVVVPVRAAPVNELPETGCPIGNKEQGPPAFVLLNMDPFMSTNGSELFSGDGQDDMAENDAAIRKSACTFAATSMAITPGDFQCSG